MHKLLLVGLLVVMTALATGCNTFNVIGPTQQEEQDTGPPPSRGPHIGA